MFVVGQSLECWRPPLVEAVRNRNPAPLLARAHRQHDAGAVALDVNFGARSRPGLAADLLWAASTLRAALPDVPLFLDCADLEALAEAVTVSTGPVVVNAVPVEPGPQSERTSHLLQAAAARGAGAVFAPRAALDVRDEPEAILAAAEEALALAGRAGIAGPLYLDCLAYPAATHAAHCRRSLRWLRAVHDAGMPALQPIVAVGNVGHGAPRELRGALEAIYVALAIASGAAALILRAENSSLMSPINVMTRRQAPASAFDRWSLALSALPHGELFTLPPPEGASRAAWHLLMD